MASIDDEEANLRTVALQNSQTILLARRRAEEELRKQSEWLRITLSSIGDAVISTDADGRVTFMNTVAEKLTGWRQTEAVGRPLSEIFQIFNVYTRQRVENPALQALQHGETVGLANHTILVAKDGVERPIDDSAAPIRDDAGSIVGAALVFRDVTGRNETEIVHARLAAIVESSQDAIISKSLQGKILSWNKGAERLFEYTAEEAIGRAVNMLIPPDRQDEEFEILARLANGERIEHFETVRISKTGKLIDISLTVSPIRDALGTVIGASKVARNITDRKRAEAALRAADVRKDQFIALLAHELRNPLAPLRSGLHVLRLSANDATTVTRTREMMERQLSHMVRLIDDLLDISRIGQNKVELRRSRVLLADVVSSAVETAAPAIEANRHRLTLSLPVTPIYLDADLTRLSQVFSNLLTNSAKYTPPGGAIWLSAEQRQSDVVVSVKDSGMGIPKDALPTVFTMFSQLDRGIERSTGGLGIGLALVKGLVEMHGGRVTAASDGPGKGSTFEVTLPTITGETETSFPVAIESPLVEETPKRAKRRILVADDNQDAADTMAMTLRLLGNEVQIAYDGIAAIEVAETFQPQVILMDVGMPKLNGYDATLHIRKQPWGSRPIIIALTGWGQESDRARSNAVGCDGHLVKPVRHADLESMLGEIERSLPPERLRPSSD